MSGINVIFQTIANPFKKIMTFKSLMSQVERQHELKRRDIIHARVYFHSLPASGGDNLFVCKLGTPLQFIAQIKCMRWNL